MATNSILPFAPGPGANVLSQAAYLADSLRLTGNVPGIARSDINNKALFQATLMATALAQFMADNQATNIADTLTVAQLVTALDNAILAAVDIANFYTKAQSDSRYPLKSNNLSDLASAATARTNLGLGTLSTQNSNAANITGGNISGITDLAIADGGTGASTAAAARTNLGLSTGATSTVQTSSTDGTAGRLLAVGAFGLGSTVPPVDDLDTLVETGFYQSTISTVGVPIAGSAATIIHIRTSTDRAHQIYTSRVSSRQFFRRQDGGTWSAWTEIANESSFTGANQSLLSSGFQKFLGNMILQWGTITFTAGTSNVTFPTAFPNSTFVVVPADTSAAGNLVYVGADTPTLTGFVARSSNASDTGSGRYIAIGF